MIYKESMLRKSGTKTIIAITLAGLLTGCSGMNTRENSGTASHTSDSAPNRPTEKDISAAKKEAAQLSSQILALSGLHGKVTEPGPGFADDNQVERGYYISHDWAIYDLPNDKLKTGMDNLYRSLPQNDWRIVSYAPAKSEARQLQMRAEHTRTHHLVLIEWIKGKSPGDGPGASDTPEIGVTLTSPAYQAPKGTDMNKQH
ncbi:hypothetical protein RKE29_19270 [Streptomyces sp. B1866]|uniref:hypothetical protein n=1 Tax=Streptomyces sp. B1866 TaxID=3075431 RepID=UPI00288D0C6E|nr:hypothetical protein [Streptomyces sp. B1866]MDT3398759.1 hypothetical protein [Streptomyces sp. B1866]